MLYCDNLRTVKMVHDPHSEHKRSKHVDIKSHRIKDEIGEGGREPCEHHDEGVGETSV